ncbi:MAG: HipA domain-containing protein, partial [Schwartzia sp.]|nr:HipA domain-containing protein [Schwartzia sp. (in: firmicutes)]
MSVNYFLLNKNVRVAELSIDESTGYIKDIIKLITPEHLPLLAKFSTDKRDGLQRWFQSRSIPKARKNLEKLLAHAGAKTANALSLKSLGLNLSDQYWFCPAESDLSWEDVNLFQNDFQRQGFASAEKGSSSYSPDSSSNGELPKFWSVENGKRYLYKEGNEPYFQQPYNEVFASELLDVLKLPHISYSLADIDGTSYSVCETFITADTEYVPALYIRDVCEKTNNENDYQHFFRCTEALAIPCTRIEIDNMLAFDYLIQNGDRHFGNFGFIRDVNTLKYLGVAPLFDHGNSLWYKSLTPDMVFRNQEAKPFRDKQDEQIKLIKATSLPLEKLSKDLIQNLTQKVFGQNPRIDEARRERIAERVSAAAEYLQSRQNEQESI